MRDELDLGMREIGAKIRSKARNLEKISDQIDGYVSINDSASLRSFIEQRRLVPHAMQDLISHCEAALLTTSLEKPTDLNRAFRLRASEFRANLATLQSVWPMPAISQNVDGYRRDKNRFNLQLDSFVNWIVEEFTAKIEQD